MISHDHGNDPYSQSRLWCEGGGGKLQAHGGYCPFTRRAGSGTYGLVPRPMPIADAEADIETYSFDFRACVVP
jgi:hypothetical protein